jgi:AcrR family transcriptional regulator
MRSEQMDSLLTLDSVHEWPQVVNALIVQDLMSGPCEGLPVSTDDPSPAHPRYGHGREALLRAAIQVVVDQGLRNLTYRAVARRAGVTHGLVAHHFGNREVLLTEALRLSLETSVPSVSERPGSGDIDALFAGLAKLASTHPDDQAFQYELILESRRRPELRPLVEAIHDAYVSQVRTELTRAGLDTDGTLSHLAYSAADGLVFHQITIGNPDLTQRALDLLRTLLRGASAGLSGPTPRTVDE